MNRSTIVHIIRAVILVLVQVLILKRIAFSLGDDFAFIHFFIYPLIIFLLPLNIPRPVVLLLSFLLGIIIDLFYNSPGIHASACVFTAYVRPFVLNWLEPQEGYSTNFVPTYRSLGFSLFLMYSTVLLGAHLFFYFSVESFSFVFIFEIVLNSIFSLIASLLLMQLLMLIFNPES